MPVEGKHITQEQFYAYLEKEMRKIEQFTKEQVQAIRKILADVETKVSIIGSSNKEETERMHVQVEKAGEDFLR